MEKNIQFNADYISGAVNPVYNCMDIQDNALIYGCSNQIFFYNLKTKKVCQTLKGHKERVN